MQKLLSIILATIMCLLSSQELSCAAAPKDVSKKDTCSSEAKAPFKIPCNLRMYFHRSEHTRSVLRTALLRADNPFQVYALVHKLVFNKIPVEYIVKILRKHLINVMQYDAYGKNTVDYLNEDVARVIAIKGYLPSKRRWDLIYWVLCKMAECTLVELPDLTRLSITN